MAVHCQLEFNTTLGIDEAEGSKIYLHVLQYQQSKVQVHDSFKHLSHHWLPEEGLHVEFEHEQQAGHDQSVET